MLKGNSCEVDYRRKKREENRRVKEKGRSEESEWAYTREFLGKLTL